MLKVSDITGKQLISLSDASTPGYVSGVWTDGRMKRAKSAEILSDEDAAPERRYVPFNLLRLGEDAAVICSPAVLREDNLSSAAFIPLSRPCFNREGKSLGIVRDLVLDGCNVVSVVTDGATLEPSRLVSASDGVCIFDDGDNPVKPPRSPRKRNVREKKPAAHEAVAASESSANEPPSATAPARAYESEATHTPASNEVKVPGTPQSVTVTHTPGEAVKDYSFLMGKPVHAAVISKGRVLIPAGVTVDEQVIEYARRENKLVQLALRAF